MRLEDNRQRFNRTAERAKVSAKVSPPEAPVLGEKAPVKHAAPGEIRLRKIRDNQPGNGNIHDVIEIKTDTGDVKRFTSLEPYVEDGEIKLRLAVKRGNKTEYHSVTMTKIEGV